MGISLQYDLLAREIQHLQQAEELDIRDLGQLYWELKETQELCRELINHQHGKLDATNSEALCGQNLRMLELELSLKGILENNKSSLKLQTEFLAQTAASNLEDPIRETFLYQHIAEMVNKHSVVLGIDNPQALLGPLATLAPEGSKKNLPSRPIGSVRGIANLGNSCYINSTLQALFAVPAFQRKLLAPIAQNLNEDLPTYQKRQAAHRALQSCYRLYRDPSKTPDEVKEGVRLLRNSLFTLYPDTVEFQRNPTGQKDSAEFMEALFKLVDLYSNPAYLTGAMGRSSLMRMNFLPGESLQGIVNNFFAIYQDDVVDPLPRIQPPEIAVIQLSRFGGRLEVKNGKQVWVSVKNNNPITMPPGEGDIVDLSGLMGRQDPVYYRLKAVVNHLGNSCRSGHYVASVRADGEEWVKCNDKIVQKIQDTPKAPLLQQAKNSGYLFVLEKCDF